MYSQTFCQCLDTTLVCSLSLSLSLTLDLSPSQPLTLSQSLTLRSLWWYQHPFKAPETAWLVGRINHQALLVKGRGIARFAKACLARAEPAPLAA
ncbi:hypothetical protein LX36DRAFT_211115 [Colletotrichum falcatum]|nr:hypothetical protein LX36DRAFT_211115 [Colletotrichum falcatum]